MFSLGICGCSRHWNEVRKPSSGGLLRPSVLAKTEAVALTMGPWVQTSLIWLLLGSHDLRMRHHGRQSARLTPLASGIIQCSKGPSCPCPSNSGEVRKVKYGDIPGGTAIKIRAPNSGGLGSIPGPGTRSYMPQLRSPIAATKEPASCN